MTGNPGGPMKVAKLGSSRSHARGERQVTTLRFAETRPGDKSQVTNQRNPANSLTRGTLTRPVDGRSDRSKSAAKEGVR
jgi:hypothetical protein